jgi:hypothetical protein
MTDLIRMSVSLRMVRMSAHARHFVARPLPEVNKMACEPLQVDVVGDVGHSLVCPIGFA